MKSEKIMNNLKRTSHFGFATALLLGFLTFPGLAQDQPAQNQPAAPASDRPLGDYARKVHKDDQANKAKPKVFDNDNLPREDNLSIVGQPAAEAANNPTDATAPAAAGQAATENKPGEAKTPEAGMAPPAADTKTTKSPAEEEKSKQAEWKQWQD